MNNPTLRVDRLKLPRSELRPAESLGRPKGRIRFHAQHAHAACCGVVSGYRRNTERVRQALGLPIETMQSIQALDQPRRQYVRAVADYNRAQFRLHRALEWPVEQSAIAAK